jgi:hypothetical protein
LARLAWAPSSAAAGKVDVAESTTTGIACTRGSFCRVRRTSQPFITGIIRSTKIWFLLVCALLPERECDNERAADAKLTFDPYLAAVGADNQLATVEAQPGAFD